jgi:uncharacterized protein (DUF2225 family)
MIDIKLLASRANVVKFDTGAIIAKEYEECSEMFILLLGKMNIIKNLGLPNERIVDVLTPGNIFNLVNFFNESSCTETAVAVGETTVATINKANYISLAKKNINLFIQLLETLSFSATKFQNQIRLYDLEKQNMIEYYNIDEEDFYKSMLYPKGHGKYPLKRPEEFDNFLYPDNFTCPHCNQSFDSVTALTSKLVTKGELGCDLRRNYQSFDVLWYEVITCPHCYFSALESGFDASVRLKKERYNDKLELIRKSLQINLKEPRTLDRVFTSYYLALICSAGFESQKQIDSKLLLSLSWLYGDAKDSKMEGFANEKALEATKLYYSETVLSSEATQINLMILGTLSRKTQKYNDAMLYLSKAMSVPDGKSVYKRIIDIEMDEIRYRNK